MKKQSIFVIGIVVVVISCLGEGALSILEHEQWSNYVQTWETPWSSVNKKKVKKPTQEIPLCSEKLARVRI
jgi:hypothetical protein